MGLPLW